MKRFYTIGCCGIDCGLCPRYYTKGDSVCPGCGGLNFGEKHPSCGFLNCCVHKNALEVCSLCKDFPCKRFDKERNGYDSFVTHRKIFTNHDFIRKQGVDRFIDQQKMRIDMLKKFLSDYDDGHSKSLFCISCALLPLPKLLETQRYMLLQTNTLALKDKNKILKDKLHLIAENLKIELKLNNKIANEI